jgi:DNA-directed RNA polymerase subunit RPC12/RpoP
VSDCVYCSGPLLPAPDLAGQLVACPHCGYQFTIAPQIKPRQRYRRDEGSRAACAIASLFIPGLGQLVQGRVEVAACMFGFAVVFGALSLFYLGIPGLVIVWVWSILDAALTTARR